MSVLYLLTAPPPAIEGTDAVWQEAVALRCAFDGEIVNLFPFKQPNSPFPIQLYGFHAIRRLRKLERRCKLNHLYFPVPYSFPVLNLLRNPIVHTVTATLDARKKPKHLARLHGLHRIVVSNERDAEVLKGWGFSNYAVIPPGIDSSRLVAGSLPLGKELTLVMASSPWLAKQFDLKGIDDLLAAAAQIPSLRLIFLWRGLLADELMERVARLGIAPRVEIINRKVEVSDYLKRAHAAVLLAKCGDIVRSYPHSLVESLVAGKPVLISNTIAMSDYVRQHQCGIVVDDVSVGSLKGAITALTSNYRRLAGNAARIGTDSFSLARMIENHRRLYSS